MANWWHAAWLLFSVCSQRRCSVLQWNPDVATQLVVASEDDRTPTLQMWDLRNSMSPVKEFVGHVKVGTSTQHTNGCNAVGHHCSCPQPDLNPKMCHSSRMPASLRH